MENLDSKTSAFLNTYSGQELLKKHRLEEVSVWEVRGEDPNCDFGGYHHAPYIGTYSGSLIDIVEMAANLPNFWTWGSGGEIKEVKIKKIAADTSAKRKKLKEEIARAEQKLKEFKLQLEQMQ